MRSVEQSNAIPKPKIQKERIATKTTIIALVSAVAVSQAAIIQFDLSPPGTDGGMGLNPANEVPPVINSTGSGNEVSGGIWFDTVDEKLTLALGYGSAAGFTDLTGPAISMHIHGPAGAGTNASVLINLAPFHFPAPDPSKGGVILGTVEFPAAEVPRLLAGHFYVNIHTAANAGGEIRGQLIPLINVAPEVVCSENATVECGQAATFTATVSDADSEPIEVVWWLNGVPVQTNSIAASSPPTPTAVVFTASLPSGNHTLAVTATDSTGNSTSCSATVVVVDTLSPTITRVAASPDQLWPPNHQMVPVRLRAAVTDDCGPTTWRIISVTSSEPVTGKGDGNTSPDWQITGDHTVNLRAERSGKNKAGRIYTITIQATDEAGNLSETKTVKVTVPHSQRK